MPEPLAAENLGAFFRALGGYGATAAVAAPDRRLTYEELERESSLVARSLLGAGVAKYARIGTLFGNSPDWVLYLASVIRMGAVAAPMSTLGRTRELAATIRHGDLHGLILPREFLGVDYIAMLETALPELTEASGPELCLKAAPLLRWIVVVGDGELPAWARSAAWLHDAPPAFSDDLLREVESELHPDDPTLMIFTSGSTSAPKGVLHSHRSVLDKTQLLTYEQRFEPGTCTFTSMPFFWVGGLMLMLMPTLAIGGTQCCTDRFDAGEVLEVIERERVNRIYLSPPPHVSTLINHPDFAKRDRSSLRFANPGLLASEPDYDSSPCNLRNGLVMGLGMSETLGPYWWGTPDDTDKITPRLEYTPPGVDVKVLHAEGRPAVDGETGELLVRAPFMTLGLHKVDRTKSFDVDGFYRTGDSVLVDGPYLRFRGRLVDVIKSSGANVSPAEVASALLSFDGIAAAHVVGLPDRERGEVVAAVVVHEPGMTVDVDEVRAKLRTQLSSFKVPRVIVVIDDEAELPLTATNKLGRKQLIEFIQERLRD